MGGTGNRSDSDHGLRAECIHGKKSKRVGESERSELQTWTDPRGNTQASDGQTRPSRAKSRQQPPHAVWTLSHTVHSHIITPIFCHLIIHISHSQFARCTFSIKRIEHSPLSPDSKFQSHDHSHTAHCSSSYQHTATAKTDPRASYRKILADVSDIGQTCPGTKTGQPFGAPTSRLGQEQGLYHDMVFYFYVGSQNRGTSM